MRRSVRLVLNAMLYFVSIGTFVVAVLVAILLFYPPKSLEVTEGPKTTQNEYYPGDAIEYTEKICAYTPVTYDLNVSLVDGANYSYGSQLIHRDPGCSTIRRKNVIIPLTQPPGKYHLELIKRIQVNIIRTDDKFYSSNEFMILPCKVDIPCRENK